MNAVFVDTAGWMSCADSGDPENTRSCEARDAALESGQLLVTTDFVVDETLTLIRMRLGAKSVRSWWQLIDQSTRLRWEHIDPSRFGRALNLFLQYSDKAFSFTHCTSFAVMRELRIDRALTTDNHFRQFGFEVLPKPARRRKP